MDLGDEEKACSSSTAQSGGLDTEREKDFHDVNVAFMSSILRELEAAETEDPDAPAHLPDEKKYEGCTCHLHY